MKKILVVFTLLCLTLVFVSFQKGYYVGNIKNLPHSINGVSEFKKALMENKIQFNTAEIEEQSEFPIIPGKRELFIIDSERVIVYKISSYKDAEQCKSIFDKGGCTIGNNKISWAGHPHFYQKWNLIIEYVGHNDEVAKKLETVLGKQFSGQ